MKPSLWDLKRTIRGILDLALDDHEAIPMGFETRLEKL